MVHKEYQIRDCFSPIPILEIRFYLSYHLCYIDSVDWIFAPAVLQNQHLQLSEPQSALSLKPTWKSKVPYKDTCMSHCSLVHLSYKYPLFVSGATFSITSLPVPRWSDSKIVENKFCTHCWMSVQIYKKTLKGRELKSHFSYNASINLSISSTQVSRQLCCWNLIKSTDPVPSVESVDY